MKDFVLKPGEKKEFSESLNLVRISVFEVLTNTNSYLLSSIRVNVTTQKMIRSISRSFFFRLQDFISCNNYQNVNLPVNVFIVGEVIEIVNETSETILFKYS